jgi:hypothetical protein
MTFSPWYHHIPSVNTRPVQDGVWVKVYDYMNNVFEGWSHEFDWSWASHPYGNITHYCIRESEGMAMLRGIAASPPDVLIEESGYENVKR